MRPVFCRTFSLLGPQRRRVWPPGLRRRFLRTWPAGRTGRVSTTATPSPRCSPRRVFGPPLPLRRCAADRSRQRPPRLGLLDRLRDANALPKIIYTDFRCGILARATPAWPHTDLSSGTDAEAAGRRAALICFAGTQHGPRQCAVRQSEHVSAATAPTGLTSSITGPLYRAALTNLRRWGPPRASSRRRAAFPRVCRRYGGGRGAEVNAAFGVHFPPCM